MLDETMIVRTVRHIVHMLVDGRYAELETLTDGTRLSEKQIRQAISEYGRTLVNPSAEAFEELYVVAVTGVTPRRWSVGFDLWTEEEDQSDLSLELALIETDAGQLLVELNNIHTL